MLIKDPPAEITPRLLMLGTNEYPLYLYQGDDEAAIFEGGTGAMGPRLRRQIRRRAIREEAIKQVIITHAHPDHVMAVPLFRDMFPEVTVLASEAAAKTLSIDKAISAFCQLDDAISASLLKAGVITDEHHRPPLAEKQIAVDRLIKEGDTIAVDGACFDVLETPGHSDCSLSFHEPTEKTLLISDATGYYVPQSNWWWPNYFVDYGSYISSMQRLAALDAEVLCLSHNGVIKGGQDVRFYFRGAITATVAYHERIIAEANAGRTIRQIAEQLGTEVYEKTQLLPVAFFQKNCGMLVKQSLRHEGMGPDK